MIFDFNDLNTLFNSEGWLQENFGCEFYPANSGWLNSSCPFEDHTDSSPSFGINQDKGIFKCFGCGRDGSLIKLVMMLMNVDFYPAINIIAVYSNIDLDNSDSLTIKSEKFKKAILEKSEEENKYKRIIQKTTIKIKNIMKQDFEAADKMYKQMDDYTALSDYNAIKEMVNGTIG